MEMPVISNRPVYFHGSAAIMFLPETSIKIVRHRINAIFVDAITKLLQFVLR